MTYEPQDPTEARIIDVLARTLDANRLANLHHAPTDRVAGALVALLVRDAPSPEDRQRTIALLVASILRHGGTRAELVEALDRCEQDTRPVRVERPR